MFYAALLRDLPRELREHVNGYLGNRSKILLHEATIFYMILNLLYHMIFQITNELYSYVRLPQCEFRDHLFDLHDLRLDFAEYLIPVGVSFVDHLYCVSNWSSCTDYSEFLSKHDWMFTRATFKIVSILNLFLQLRHQDRFMVMKWEECLEACGLIQQLRMANCRYVLGRLVIPDEVLN